MDFDLSDFMKRFTAAVNALEKAATAALCKDLIAHLRLRPDVFPEKTAKQILQALRRKRSFDLMQQVADALILSGQSCAMVRRQYAQSLLDLNNLSAALDVLKSLVRDTASDPAEYNEARGLLGRAYKQLYVNAAAPQLPRNQQYLAEAVRLYHEVYQESSTNLWHGINAVALLLRAVRDGVSLADYPEAEKTARQIARDILADISDREVEGAVTTWDFATAIEACVALNDSSQAMDWLARYIKADYTDAFELASTLRQLTEVWQLDMTSEMGLFTLPMLRAALLEREGGSLELTLSDLKNDKHDEGEKIRLEKVFGQDSYVTLTWYQTGIDRCRAVAQICTEMGEGFGTGFLVKGSELHASLGDELLLLTNAHVVSNDPKVSGALQPEDALVKFEALGLSGIRVKELIFTSPPLELDATLLRLDKAVTESMSPYPIAKLLPAMEEGKQQRVYIVGHPRGGGLSFSMNDNLLLAHKDPRIHYRTPTEGGSSGSPVFNQQWKLIGLHHAGGNLARLDGQPGTYEANEGLWIGAIKAALAQHLG